MGAFLESYPIIKQVGPWIGGAVGGFLISIINNRRPLLIYHVTHDRIGMTAEDEVHGKVEVTYRGSVVHNLYLSVVTIRNASIKDFENLELKSFAGNDNVLLLSEQSAITGTLETVPHSQAYVERVTEDANFEQEVREAGTVEEPENKTRLDADLGFRHRQRWYSVPVLNRGQKMKITYLTHVAANTLPAIYMTCPSKGVRIKEKRYPQLPAFLWGIPIQSVVLVGVLTSIGIYGVVVSQVSTLWIAALICLFVGLFGNICGAIVVKIYRELRDRLVG